jgi:hypothetical protein
MIRGIHKAFLLLGGLTLLSNIVFTELKDRDGRGASRNDVLGGVHLLRRLPQGATRS